MEIIDVNTVMAGWFDTFVIVMGIIALVVVVISIIFAFLDGVDRLAMGVGVLMILGLGFLVGAAMAEGVVEPEEMIRIQQEVERISGEEVTLEEVVQMLDGDPVRDVYYIQEGYTLIVEKEGA